MKKRNLKSLNLNKKAISNLDNNGLVGGTGATNVFVCPSAIVKPICFIRESDPRICTIPTN
ncbi:hypothetical protein [Kordia sp.]|uniref:hypothetical protein n=1 Tax=Kordia sp. TaxID=1965332 RepID=UPI003D269C75